MKIEKQTPPREFLVGKKNDITIKDCGKLFLSSDEQITFISKNNKEYDVVKKDWGYYATPSINGRLKKYGYKTALVKNNQGKYYIMLVDLNKQELFKMYIKNENNFLVQWLDELD